MTKNRNFFYLCFSLKLCQKTSFFNIHERKQSFLDQKIEVLKRADTWTFFKGVSPWIFSKNRTFTYGRFSQKSIQKRSFLIFWKKKNDFKRKKIKVLKREKKWAFSKGISPWKWSKNRTFSYGRFSQKSYKKTSFLILWKEKNDFKRKKLKF